MGTISSMGSGPSSGVALQATPPDCPTESPTLSNQSTVAIHAGRPASTPDDTRERDEAIYRGLIATDLTEAQRERIAQPPQVYPRQASVLGLHWHPEFVPMDLIRQRIEAAFPNREDELIIPTQHNELTAYGPYTGVEIDCFSPSFNRKVQLLVHFASEKLEGRGGVFRAMLAHTFQYRQSQLFELIDSILLPDFQERVNEAASRSGAEEDVVEFVRDCTRRLSELIHRHESTTPAEMLKNKLIRNYLDALRDDHEPRFIDRAQRFLKAIKEIVKEQFSLRYFYETNQVIEEVRALGGCIVIPHPEQFWPVLLEDLDIDGIEVWNPQSLQYTRFLIDVVDRRNRDRHRRDRPILVTMGDDCHMGEKAKDPRHQDEAKAAREIGVQPAWDDLDIRKRLILADFDRDRVIEHYRSYLV